jgi:hypothetical protein
MRRVPVPVQVPSTVYLTCIGKVRSAALKAQLLAAEPAIAIAANEYDQHANAKTLYLVPTQNGVGAVTAAEMTKVYTQRMAHPQAPGRPIYDALLAAPVLGICPLCGHGDVATLDHYLPKTEFSAITVLPLNLVPACRDCNFTKLKNIPAAANEQPLHPYYDDVQDELWLRANVIQGPPVALQYYVGPPGHWSQVLQERVNAHFAAYGLARLFATQAARKLNNIRGYIRNLHQNGGEGVVAAHLEAMADSVALAHVNSWETAMYRALANDAWYCSGGFEF